MSSYDPHRWTSHLFDVEGSMVREILCRVLASVSWSIGVVLAYQFGPESLHRISIPPTAHSLIGTALGLLLVYRTNSSYDRFWEGRKMWGGIANECRNLARQTGVWLAADRPLMQEVIRWTMAFPYSTMQRIRGAAGIGTVLDGIDEREIQRVEASRHVPLAVARNITSRLLLARQRGVIDGLQLASLDNNVQLLMDYCGACERIRTTPLPFAYAVHLRRVLIVYCFTLPFALVKDYGWTTVLATLFISYILYGIEEIGVEIEDPFGFHINDLPIRSFCESNEFVLSEIRDQIDPI
ncbi:bestrophin family protein [Schlesneria paludicola]|uniref:bestrophin family protein n=1 Tax=Schlesneria paludicola TaxID=360056 RepID=UPI00029AEA5A|nr:bestrophin family protein [Schlesneria paludicola]